MANFDEIDKVVKLLKKKILKFYFIALCKFVSNKDKRCKPQRIEKLQKRYKCKIGYSDHTKSISAAISSTFFWIYFFGETLL